MDKSDIIKNIALVLAAFIGLLIIGYFVLASLKWLGFSISRWALPIWSVISIAIIVFKYLKNKRKNFAE